VRVKDNQPRLHDALLALGEAQPAIDHLDTVDRHAHGREEHRRVEVFTVDDCLDPDWRPFIACVARITRRSLCRDTRTGLWRPRREVAYYACQIPLDAQACAAAIRGHWGIENRNHHVRDRTLGEDASRIRRQPGIVARLRSFALNILRAHSVGNVSEAIYTNALSLDRLLAYGLPKSQN
jgi:predicted transposase YbfD/YdcC